MAGTPHAAVLTFSLLGAIVIGFIILGMIIWLWGSFLDVHEHNPARVRSAMMVILVFSTMCELGFSSYEWTRQWVGMISLAVNVWGGLDALLRFPAAHDFESFFAAKQVALLLVKTFAYTFGIIDFRQHIGKFLVVLLIVIWGLPVLYLMALPLDPAEQVAADERDDVDLAVKVWRLTTCHVERKRHLGTCKSWLHRRLFSASKCSPIARIALCAASSTYKRAYSKGRFNV
jgi:hypothetical protein